MKQYKLGGNLLPYYSTLGDTLHTIQSYCGWDYFEEDHIPENYKRSGSWKIYYYSFHDAEKYLGLKPKYKFIKAKAKKTIRRKIYGNSCRE